MPAFTTAQAHEDSVQSPVIGLRQGCNRKSRNERAGNEPSERALREEPT